MGMGGGGMQFTIDGKMFDPERVDQTVQMGTVEEWTLTNASPMDHPMHLHVWPMQVIAQGAGPSTRSRGATSSTSPRAAMCGCASPSTATPAAPSTTATSSTTRTTA